MTSAAEAIRIPRVCNMLYGLRTARTEIQDRLLARTKHSQDMASKGQDGSDVTHLAGTWLEC